MPGTKPEDYGLPPGERLNEVITQSWNRLRRHWADFRTAAKNLVRSAIDQQASLLENDLPALQKALAVIARSRAANQLTAHERVREATKARGRVTIEPVLPVDILGAYVLLPKL